MTNYEKDLKTLKKEMHGKRIFLENDTVIPMQDLRRLKAMGLVELNAYADDLLRVSLTPTGEYYDDFKKEKRKEWFALGTKELIVAVLSGGFVLLLTQILN